MPRFAVLFEDNLEGADEIRRRHMESHLAFLERHAALIQAAGPLREESGAAKGGLWLVDAATIEDVEGLVREDPFWSAELRRSVHILVWNRVFANGSRCAQ
jgi:uncharacterized protein YciI